MFKCLPSKQSFKILKNEINEQTKWKQTHSYREHPDGCQMGGRLGAGGKGKGIKKYKLEVIKTVMGM